MKKTILLASLVASITTLAATEGHVNYTFKGEINSTYNHAKKASTNEFKVPETFVETEVKVKGSGLSFGGEFKAKDIELGKDAKTNADKVVKKANFLNHSNVFAKYELPEIKGVKSFVKATVKPEFVDGETDNYKFGGSAELEGQASYKYDALTFGLNSKTNFPFAKSAGNDNYGKDVKSTHKVFVESETDKDVFVKGLKDVKANVEIKHDYRKLEEQNPKAAKAVDYVKGEVSAKYDAIKDFAVEGKAGFKVNVSKFLVSNDDYFKEDKDGHDVILGGVKLNHYLDKFDGTDWIRKVTGLHREYANVKLTYTGVKGLTLSANPFVDYTEGYRKYDNNSHKVVENAHLIMFGTSLDAKYVLLNDKLTLTGNVLLSGVRDVKTNTTKTIKNRGVYVAKLGAKYDYAINSKLTVSPEFTVSSAVLTDDYLANNKAGFVTLKPEVNAVYKATDKLELKGGLSLSANFDKIKKNNNKLVGTKELELKPSASLVYKPVEGLEVNNKVELPVKFGEKTTDKSLEYKGLDVKTELNIKYSWK
ncbi:hypothetical protein ACFFBA_000803 [Sneathia vaginalis]|uniref:Uncharacterized protein n=1 Tax=Sneathia vaginalis TaxID=187101 RepID=A0A0E3UTF3_9FUSO|nr:hypothetical protein [Sneathia vaginalis]AKC95039.1 hypothetical protein VC03_00305 [Sneathia vaginalis]